MKYTEKDFKNELLNFLKIKSLLFIFPEEYRPPIIKYFSLEGAGLYGFNGYDSDIKDNLYISDTSEYSKPFICFILRFLYNGAKDFGFEFKLDYNNDTNELIAKWVKGD